MLKQKYKDLKIKIMMLKQKHKDLKIRIMMLIKNKLDLDRKKFEEEYNYINKLSDDDINTVLN